MNSYEKPYTVLLNGCDFAIMKGPLGENIIGTTTNADYIVETIKTGEFDSLKYVNLLPILSKVEKKLRNYSEFKPAEAC